MTASNEHSRAVGSEDGGPHPTPSNGLPGHVLARCFLRSLFLQASWNSKGMQNVGFLYAMEPALTHLYPDPTRREAALRRSLEPFNTHPYMAEAILGGAIHHEAAVSEERVAESRVGEFKQALAGPLAGLGDTFFWASLRPAAAALAVLLASFLGLWAVVILLVTYNLVHLAVRVRLFRAGLRLGDGILDSLGSLRLAGRANRFKAAAAVLVGLSAVVLVTTQTALLGYSLPGAPIAIVIGGALMVRLFVFFRSPYALLLAVAGVGVLLGLVGIVGTG